MALLSFKAGRSSRRDHDSNFVDPDDTKGAIQITRGDDDLLHFQWKSRVTGQIEDDLIIFPAEAEFLRASDRTYVLKFSSSSQRHFFWMQDLSSDHDDENAAHVNGYMADPEYDPSSFVPMEEEEDEVHPGNIGDSSSSFQPAMTTLPQFSQAELNRIRSLISQMSSNTTPAVAAAPDFTLSDLLTSTNLRPVLADPVLLQSILPHLPPDLPMSFSAAYTEDTVRQIIESPQFQAGARSLDRALSTGLMGGFVRSLNLPEEAGLGLAPFLDAIEQQAQSDNTSQDSNENQ